MDHQEKNACSGRVAPSIICGAGDLDKPANQVTLIASNALTLIRSTGVSMKTVITYGTFDLFHIGHLRLLQRLVDLGDRLIVAVSSDEFNQEKGKKTIIPYAQRAEIVGAIKGVDLVIREESWDQKEQDINTHDVDIFAMGDDWSGKFDGLRKHCEVVYLNRTKDISSTDIKQSLKRFLSIPPQEIAQAFEILNQIRRELE